MALHSINSQRKERLLEWMGDRPGGITTQELADSFDVHYQTAHDWLKILLKDKQIVRVEEGQPFRYIAHSRDGAGPIIVKYDNERLPVGTYAMQRRQSSTVAAFCHAIVYLFIRSYYYDAPDQQHLRGTTIPLEVRAFIEQRVKEMREHLAIAEQLLSLRAPWVEGPSFAMRFGNPQSNQLPELVEVAQVFSNLIAKNSLTGTRDNDTVEVQEENEQGE